MPLLFFIVSCSFLTIKYYRVHDYSFGLPTVKTASMFRTSLSLLIITLLEISSWAFLFAWRLESIILEDKPCKGPPLYQVINPGLAFIPRVCYHLSTLTIITIFFMLVLCFTTCYQIVYCIQIYKI